MPMSCATANTCTNALARAGWRPEDFHGTTGSAEARAGRDGSRSSQAGRCPGSSRPRPTGSVRRRSFANVARTNGATWIIPQQNGMIERLIRSLKEQCVHRRRPESLAHASRAIGDWVQFYNNQRPHQALDMKTPAEAFKLAA
ncbi:MAG: integrase core domain-containing protein [Pseudomonadota bacterium]